MASTTPQPVSPPRHGLRGKTRGLGKLDSLLFTKFYDASETRELETLLLFREASHFRRDDVHWGYVPEKPQAGVLKTPPGL